MPLLKRHGDVLLFWCPACKEAHPFELPRWTWNGSLDAPSFTPSLRLVASGCHLVLTNGIINFCADCPHEFRGRSVPMVDFDKILGGNMQEETANTQAPAENDAPLAPTPHPAFDEAVDYVLSKNLTREGAIEVVNSVGIETILAIKTAEQTGGALPPGIVAHLPAQVLKRGDVLSIKDGEATVEPPEPGMKRCSSCGIWYPGGYETCPHDGTRLQ